MMVLIEQGYARIKITILILILFSSCQKRVQDGKLECILNSIEVDANEMDIEIGQHNGWNDSTALILVTYHKKSLDIPMGSNLKGLYKGNDIYFYQSSIDSSDNKKYNQIPNNIRWKEFIPKEMDESIIQPPYDPVNIQIEYNLKGNCIVAVIRGKGYINEKLLSRCKCDY